MKQKKALKLLIRLEALRAEYRELVIRDHRDCVIAAGMVARLEERLRQNGYDPRRTEDVDV